MFGSQILEVAIGMAFIYLLISVICSAIREGLEALLKTRAAYLENGIRKLLHDDAAEGMAKSLYSHPLIDGLFPGKYNSDKALEPSFFSRGRNLPSYIPASNFAVAVMDIAARGPITDEASGAPSSPITSLASIRSNVQNMGNPAVQRVILTAIDSAEGDLNRAQRNIEAWYNSGMDRVSGWYKRKTQWIIFWVAIAIAIGLNVNTLTIAHYLYRNDSARIATAQMGVDAAQNGKIPTAADAKVEFEKFQLPIGWSDATLPSEGFRYGWISLLVGWLLTAFAASMGAPFWFDMLNRLTVVRSTVKPHEKSPEEFSKDRTGPPAPSPSPVATSGTLVAGTLRSVSDPPCLPAAFPSLADSSDAEADLDGCDIDVNNEAEMTSDRYLPVAEGGVEE